MKVDITVNVYDVQRLIEIYFQHLHPGLEVGNIAVKSWNKTVLELNNGYIEPLHHVIRPEHSDLFKPAEKG